MPKTHKVQVHIHPDPPEASDDRRKGVIQPRFRREENPRRLQRDIYVRFFDLGQLANGSERTFPVSLDTSPLDPHTLTAFDTPELNELGSSQPMDYTNYRDDYNAHLLEGDPEGWEDDYKEIIAEDNIQFEVPYADYSAYVPNKGYKFIKNEFEAYDPYTLLFTDGGWDLLWYQWITRTEGGNHVKITRTASYGDTAAQLHIDGDSSIFMVPSLKLWEGRAGEYENSSGISWRKKSIYIWGHFVQQIPRDFTRTDLFAEYWSLPTHHAGQIGGNWPVTSICSDDIKAAFYDLFMTIGSGTGSIKIDYKQFYDDWATSGIRPDINAYVGSGDFADVLGGGFKYPGNLPTLSTITDDSRYVLDEPYVRWVGWYKKAGQLLAVVHKRKGPLADRGWYYIWNTQDSDTVSTNPNVFANIPNLGTIYARTWNQFNWFGGQDRGVTLRQPGV